jgi:hypothetical protein
VVSVIFIISKPHIPPPLFVVFISLDDTFVDGLAEGFPFLPLLVRKVEFSEIVVIISALPNSQNTSRFGVIIGIFSWLHKARVGVVDGTKFQSQQEINRIFFRRLPFKSEVR